MPTVSIIIPTYNGAHYIEETIESVLAQTYKDYEIIIIDDGSTDNTNKVLGKYKNKIKYFYQKHSGGYLAKVRNFAISNSEGKYIAFLDNDDLWLKEKLEIQTTYMEKHKNISLSYTDIYYFGDYVPRELNGKSQFEVRTMNPGTYFEQLFEFNFIPVSTVLVRKECLKHVGLFDESIKYASDHDLWLRIAAKYKVGEIDKPLAKYRMHGERLSNGHEVYLGELKTLKKIAKMFPELLNPMGGKRYRIFGRVYFDQSRHFIKRSKYFEALKSSIKGNLEELKFKFYPVKEALNVKR